MKSTKLGIVGLFLFLASAAFAQQPDTLQLSLVEAINLAVQQNPQLKSVRLDEEINRAKVQEVRASALPQVTGDASFNDNFMRASQILPGEVFGKPGESIAVKFGTRFQMGATAQVSQALFNPALRIGLKAARESQGMYELQTFKSKEDLIYNVVNLYTQLQMIEKQTELVEGNLDRTQRLIDITSAQYKEGIIKKVDVEQLKVNYTNLTTQLSNTENTRTQLLNNLKTLMNVDSEQPIALTSVGVAPIQVSQQLDLSQNTDLALVDYQRKLQDLNTASIRAGYLPTLSLIANMGYQSQTNDLFNSVATQGFGAGLYGFRLSIPIFDGFARKSKITQSQYQGRQLELNRKYLMRNVENQFTNARNTVIQNGKVLVAQQENMKLAEALYDVAKLSYTEGVSPLSELINAENGLKEAQNQYLTAMLQINLAELDLMQSSGQLTQIIKQTLPLAN